MDIPIKALSICGKKYQDCWVVSYNPDLGWLKRKSGFVQMIDIQKIVLLANSHCEPYMPLFKECDEKRQLLTTYVLYINQMTRIELELNRLDEKAEKKEAKKAGYDLYPI